MRWAEGDTWTLETALPGGEYDFKFVVHSEEGGVGQWEPGANRTITVRPSPCALCYWTPCRCARCHRVPCRRICEGPAHRYF